jgi:anti-anti-sigma factor
VNRLAEVRLDERDEVQIAYVEGEIDLSNAGEIGSELEAAVPNFVQGLIVDLTGTTHLDSAGFRLLYNLRRQLETRGQVLRLVVPSEGLIAEVVSITGLDGAVAVYPTLEDALEPAWRAD